MREWLLQGLVQALTTQVKGMREWLSLELVQLNYIQKWGCVYDSGCVPLYIVYSHVWHWFYAMSVLLLNLHSRQIDVN